MGCPWYEWKTRYEAATIPVNKHLRSSHVRAEEILKRANLAMAAECANAYRKGECKQANKYCATCKNHREIGKGNSEGWCKREDYKTACDRNYNADIALTGKCWISYFKQSGTHTDCPVYQAWRPVVIRAKKLWSATLHRTEYPGAYIQKIAGPSPKERSYRFIDDDTNDPLSYAVMRREELAAAGGNTLEAELEAMGI